MSFASNVSGREIAVITRLLSGFGVVEVRQMEELFSYLGNGYGRIMARLHREGTVFRTGDTKYLAASEFTMKRTDIACSVMCFWAFMQIKDKVQDFCAGTPPAILTVAAKHRDYDLIPVTQQTIDQINETIDEIPEKTVRFLVTKDLMLISRVDRRIKNDFVLLVGDDGIVETYEL